MQRSELQSLTEAYNQVVIANRVAILVEQGKTKEEIEQILNEGLFSSIGKAFKDTAQAAGKAVKDTAQAAGITPQNIGEILGRKLGTVPAPKAPKTVASTKSKAPKGAPTATPTSASKSLADHDEILNQISDFIATNYPKKGRDKFFWKKMIADGLKKRGYTA